jgi:hypothetical protein
MEQKKPRLKTIDSIGFIRGIKLKPPVPSERARARAEVDFSAALRNDKQRTDNGKGQYGDSGCARMTALVAAAPE